MTVKQQPYINVLNSVLVIWRLYFESMVDDHFPSFFHKSYILVISNFVIPYYYSYIYLEFGKCGVYSAPIFKSSTDYETNTWPWMGSLGYWSDGKWIHLCGTTLVSKIHFITAAHCVETASGEVIDSR